MGGYSVLGKLAWSYKCIDGMGGGGAYRHLSCGDVMMMVMMMMIRRTRFLY
jgi:hypothetical protein